MPPARSRKRDDFYRDRRRRKVCAFCADKTTLIDYKEVNRLRRYLSERAKIEPRRKTGTCAGHQRELAVALKRARHVALLPYAPAAPPPLAAVHRRRVRPPEPAPDVGVGLLMIAGGTAAGVFGSLLGLGGGVLIVPLLTLGFGLDLREAVGVSLVSVIMTSSVAAGRLPRTPRRQPAARHAARAVHGDRRAGRWLDRVPHRRASPRAAVRGPAALRRGLDAPWQPADRTMTAKRPRADRGAEDDAAAEPPGRPSHGPTCRGEPDYAVRNPGRGIVGATGAGVVSALLGVGGGIVKVPLMHLAMGVPLRVATATSNLMVGITAAAAPSSTSPRRLDPYVAGPTAIGVFLGASIGSRVLAPGRPARSCAGSSWPCSSTPRSRCCMKVASRDRPIRPAIGRLLIAVTYVAGALLLIGVLLMLAGGSRRSVAGRTWTSPRSWPTWRRSSRPASCGSA